MKKGMLILALLMTACLFTGCEKEEIKEITVQNVGTVCGLGPVGLINRYGGVVVAENETKVERNEEFTLGEIKVKVGDEVTEGQTLFTYDTTVMELNIDQLNLDLERQKLALDTLKSDKEKLEAEKEKAKEDQQLAYTLEIREAAANIQESEYNIKLKEQEIEKAEKAMENSSVKSEVAGRVKDINENGGYDENGQPLPFITIVQDSTFRIKGVVNEANISALYDVSEVLIRSRVNDQVWHGVISEIDTENPEKNNDMYYFESGAGDGTSSRYPFYVIPDSYDGLMMGQHVYIEPDFGQNAGLQEEKLMLPEYFILDADSAPYVYAMNASNKTEKRAVTLGEYDEMMGTHEIVDGLTKEDYIAFPEEGTEEGMNCIIFTETVPGMEPTGAEVIPE